MSANGGYMKVPGAGFSSVPSAEPLVDPTTAGAEASEGRGQVGGAEVRGEAGASEGRGSGGVVVRGSGGWVEGPEASLKERFKASLLWPLKFSLKSEESIGMRDLVDKETDPRPPDAWLSFCEQLGHKVDDEKGGISKKAWQSCVEELTSKYGQPIANFVVVDVSIAERFRNAWTTRMQQKDRIAEDDGIAPQIKDWYLETGIEQGREQGGKLAFDPGCLLGFRCEGKAGWRSIDVLISEGHVEWRSYDFWFDYSETFFEKLQGAFDADAPQVDADIGTIVQSATRMQSGADSLKLWSCPMEFSVLRKLGGVYGNCSDDGGTIIYRNIHGSVMEWQRTNGKSLEAAEGVWVLRSASSATAESAVTDYVFYYPGPATDREPPSGLWLHSADNGFGIWVEPATPIGVYTAKHWDRRMQAAHRLGQFESATKAASVVSATVWNVFDLGIFAGWSALYLPHIDPLDYWATAIITGTICLVGIELVTEGLTTAFVRHARTAGTQAAGFILTLSMPVLGPVLGCVAAAAKFDHSWAIPGWALKMFLCVVIFPCSVVALWSAKAWIVQMREDREKVCYCFMSLVLIIFLIGWLAAQTASLWYLPCTSAPAGSWWMLKVLGCACLPLVTTVAAMLLAPAHEVCFEGFVQAFHFNEQGAGLTMATAGANACLWHLHLSPNKTEFVANQWMPFLCFAVAFCCRFAVRLLSEVLGNFEKYVKIARIQKFRMPESIKSELKEKMQKYFKSETRSRIRMRASIDTSTAADREVEVLRHSFLDIGFPQAELAKLAELFQILKPWSEAQLSVLSDAARKAEETKATKIAQAKQNVYEMIYDISQIVVMAWVEGHVSLAHSHFEWKLLADFLNWISSLIDLIVLKGPKVLAYTAGDPSKVLQLMSQTIDELEATANDAEDD